jgi:large subunit ribosomal protein L6
MSRIGKLPVTIPSGVTASIQGNLVDISGPKGKLSFELGKGVTVAQKDGALVFSAPGEDPQTKANFGTARARVNNMVLGVTKGWKKSLEMVGVGFSANLKGQELVLAVGFSHDVKIMLPAAIKCAVGKTTIDLESADRELLGTYASKIRKVQPPEPYLGKGIKYSTETVRRKAGKTGKK